jgi:hypothetical protein
MPRNSKKKRKSYSRATPGTPRALTHADIGHVLVHTFRRYDCSSTKVAELLSKINSALKNYDVQCRWRSEPTAKQHFEQFDSFRAALLRLKRTLPASRTTLFEYVSDIGEYYAELNGTHPRIDNYGLEWEGDGPPPELPSDDRPQTSYRSRERLQDLIDCVVQVANWLKYRKPHVARPFVSSHSPALVLIGFHLPQIYEAIFGKKFGLSRKGPGIRFINAVLLQSGINGECCRAFSLETVIKYRQRVLSHRGGQ